MVRNFFPSQIVEYIDLKFSHAKEQCESQAQRGQGAIITDDYLPVLSFLLTMLDNIPSHVLTLRGNDFAEYSEAIAAIRAAVNIWDKGNKNYTVQNVPGRRKWCPVALIRKQLLSLHDEGIAATTKDLLFVVDSSFRDLLRRDITTVNMALDNGEWKAATVLAGSVIEALLLDAINTFDLKNINRISPAIHKLQANKIFTRPITQPPDEWDLYHLTEVALELKLIKIPTAGLCRIAREFRNLVHPGKTLRSAQACDRGTAFSAVAAMEHVIRDLSNP